MPAYSNQFMNYPKPQSRRRLLQLLCANTASFRLARSAWSQPRFASNPFTLGGASGSPTSDSRVLWTRLHVKGVFGASLGPDPLTVRWELARDDQLTRVVQSGLSMARPITLSRKV
jgi:alkaline phosphatase D